MSDMKLPPLPIPDGVGRHGDDLFYTYQMKAYARQCVLADRAARANEPDPIAWEATTSVYIKYITDARYRKFRSGARRWYKPYRCSNCAAPTKERGADDE